MDFILVSGNKHKASELALLFEKSKSVTVKAADKSIDVVEDGTTYEENAFKKAKAYFDKYNCPVVSDDSGLEVQALPGELGLYSARFGGEGLNDDDRVNLLLEKLSDSEDRSAYFICVICFYISHDEVMFFEGRVNGRIGSEKKGEEGFGYDPVFIPEKHEGDETFAQIPEWKFLNGHRARAVSEAIKYFN